eukprot:2831124-Rhodomonas_salina.3
MPTPQAGQSQQQEGGLGLRDRQGGHSPQHIPLSNWILRETRREQQQSWPVWTTAPNSLTRLHIGRQTGTTLQAPESAQGSHKRSPHTPRPTCTTM